MEKCPRCKNESLESEIIRYSQEYEGQFYIVENVPARVCRLCGEVMMSERVAETVQEIIWSGAKPKRTEQVPVYDAAELNGG